ncbi:glycosyl hydrolase family 61-domain-containing protein [Podospora aff. communis PSN243]|uniref:lytic cellulose monooxygenase (C4-dehydrogenating) n=1 Tax=Podospora aff. communis PSN243 TaxID=3040156 RepID=A0AAV9GYA8_9PEZI|nr:glycosyl hydrolase family 61-domain-containing protein [Podospora aff. communis PSN243]
MPSTTSALLSALAGAATVAAHGHVTNLVINGESYSGFLANVFPYQQNPPVVAGWTAGNTDNGFVGPEAFASPDIICHRSATNAKGHAVVAAGDSIFIQWDTWPESHHGPVIDYLANCGASGCETVDKTSLEFFKIDEAGLVDGSNPPGIWASDQLIENNNSWMVKIPESIAPGFYVLRHEIIALHSGNQENGAQNYPQCFNLQVTGGGSARPAGVKGTSLYTPRDAGILFNIYQPISSYPIPGPALMAGAVPVVQGSSAVTASATAITGSAAATATRPATTTTNAAVPTTLATTTTSAAAPPATTTAAVQTTARPSATGCAGPVIVTASKKGKPRKHPRQLAMN